MAMNLEVAVENGIEWLNKNGPADWWDRINLDTLNIDSPHDCVLGQVFAANADETGLISGYIYVMSNWPGINVFWYGFCSEDAVADELTGTWVHNLLLLRAVVNA